MKTSLNHDNSSRSTDEILLIFFGNPSDSNYYYYCSVRLQFQIIDQFLEFQWWSQYFTELSQHFIWSLNRDVLIYREHQAINRRWITTNAKIMILYRVIIDRLHWVLFSLVENNECKLFSVSYFSNSCFD